MKTTKLLLLAHVIGCLILIINTGCTKDPETRITTTPPPPPSPPPVLNTPPQVSAGANIGVFLPVDSAFLFGYATDAENNIDSYRWSQLSGPSQAIIQTPDSPKTKISKLTKGEYNFELTVIDKGNLSGKATVKVLVNDSSSAGTNMLILKVLEVTCWGPECTVVVDISNTNIYQNLPVKVSLRSVGSPVWVEIPQQNYRFSPNGDFFWFEWYGLDDRKKWEVMIVY
jgi:hypothetical protein